MFARIIVDKDAVEFDPKTLTLTSAIYFAG